MIPNERQVTQSGVISGATRGDGAVFTPNGVVTRSSMADTLGRSVGLPHHLLGVKTASGRADSGSVNRP